MYEVELGFLREREAQTPEGYSHIKRPGMLIVLLWGFNQGFIGLTYKISIVLAAN